MRYLIMLFFMGILFIQSFSYNIDDYLFFDKALKANEKKDFKESEFFYKIYERNYKDSYPLTSNYAKYYIAKNYMDLGKYEEAILYFSRAVYVPEEFVKQKTKKTNFFQYRRDYYVGEIYLKLNNHKKSNEFLERLVTDYYDPKLTPYEIKALNLLRIKNPKYEFIYRMKYKGDFSVIDKLNSSELEGLSKYFFEKKEYKKTKIILEKLYNISDKKRDIEIRYLETLLKLNENKKIIEFTQDKTDMKLIFIRAVAYEQAKDYSRALYNYNLLNQTDYQDRAMYRTARIYFKLEEYKKVKNILEKIISKNEKIDELMLDVYVKLENRSKFLKFYEDFRSKYPENPKLGLYYMIYTKLLNNNQQPWDMANYSIFFTSNYAVRNYIDSLENFNLEETFKEKILKSALTQIGELGNSELLDLATRSKNFDLDIDTVRDKITVIDSFAKSSFYKEAFEKSKKYKRDMYRYRNLLHNIYPKYYWNEVESARKKNLIPQSLIYTVMYIESGFDKNNDKFDRIGLMGIPLEGILEKEKYFDPQENIELGTKLLKQSYEKNNAMILKTLIDYLYGETVLKSLNFELDGDLKLETVGDDKLQKEIEEIVYTYAFYSAIYN
ncbi:transglycosylase SLT domain-containing protein [uncultured Cetobacterium sp.]|uniref:transglycosylase SLT domain-containing protein n=1 Tax=uncultured Cetobacterium sp. TaxID=527638 RepID=UPI002636B94D|nr:transglycosylase SLT domain-containing protein [uncultured Cetobacterium sp.]